MVPCLASVDFCGVHYLLHIHSSMGERSDVHEWNEPFNVLCLVDAFSIHPSWLHPLFATQASSACCDYLSVHVFVNRKFPHVMLITAGTKCYVLFPTWEWVSYITLYYDGCFHSLWNQQNVLVSDFCSSILWLKERDDDPWFYCSLCFALCASMHRLELFLIRQSSHTFFVLAHMWHVPVFICCVCVTCIVCKLYAYEWLAAWLATCAACVWHLQLLRLDMEISFSPMAYATRHVFCPLPTCCSCRHGPYGMMHICISRLMCCSYYTMFAWTTHMTH